MYWLIWSLNNISTLVFAIISAVGGIWGIIAHFIKGKKLSQGIWLLFISIILMPIVIIGNEVVEVPLVEGTTCNEAYFMLSERGLVGTPIIVTGQVVVSQDPKAGELALKGDHVNLLFTESEPVSMIEDDSNIEQEKREWMAEYELYSRERDNPYAQINAGYILANHLIDEEDRDDEAIQFYERANCIEAERNLFALYLKRLTIKSQV